MQSCNNSQITRPCTMNAEKYLYGTTDLLETFGVTISSLSETDKYTCF